VQVATSRPGEDYYLPLVTTVVPLHILARGAHGQVGHAIAVDIPNGGQGTTKERPRLRARGLQGVQAVAIGPGEDYYLPLVTTAPHILGGLSHGQVGDAIIIDIPDGGQDRTKTRIRLQRTRGPQGVEGSAIGPREDYYLPLVNEILPIIARGACGQIGDAIAVDISHPG
jgi:hypothetical protein